MSVQSKSQSAPPVPISVGQLASQFARTAGIDTPTVWPNFQSGGGLASVSREKFDKHTERMPTLTVGTQLADFDRFGMSFIVAHEIAHVALGHPKRNNRDWTIFGLFLSFASLPCVMLAFNSAPFGVVQIFLLEMSTVGVYLVTVMTLVTGALIFAHCQRRREYAADAFATKHFGCPMTTEVCERIRKREGWRQTPRVFATHPHPRKRLRATQKLSATTASDSGAINRNAMAAGERPGGVRSGR